MGRVPTKSEEKLCKYCGVTYYSPQHLKAHIFMDHWGTNRQRMYLKEEEYNAFMKEHEA